nr:homologous-pairing protein 2 homolog isoform X1 [Leptinotarsa decemlineata]
MACKDAVLKFLEDHNRPFSNNDIQGSVPGGFCKSAVQKALDSLIDENKVKEKVYGKQKVYCILQNNDSSGNQLREDLLEMDRKINETTIELKEISDQLKIKSQLVAQLKGKISLEDAIDQKIRLDKELEDVKQQLSRFSEVELICPKKKLATENEYEKYLKVYKQRKRMCLDMVDSILENYPKTKKHLYEDIGLETDEDAGFSINE